MKGSKAEVVREYGPFPGAERVHGVSYDGQHVWFGCGDKLNAFDPSSGQMQHSIDVAAHAGTAFDGQHLFQIAENRIQKIDPKTAAECWPQSPRPATAETRGSRGLKARSGSDNIEIAKSIRSILIPAPSSAPSSRTASSLASPGWMANSGTQPLKVTKVNCVTLTPTRERCLRFSKCRVEQIFQGLSPMEAIDFSAEDKRAEN